MNDKGWTDWNLSKPREEWGAIEAGGGNYSRDYYNSAEHYYNKQDKPLSYDTRHSEAGYRSIENYYNAGFSEVGGPNIGGKTPSELIQSGTLTPDTISEEDRKVIYDDFMMGYTNDKEMMAKKIDLMIDDSELINQVVFNQYKLAISEMKKENRGSIDHTPRDRKFQFLATVKMLMEKGYDIDSLHFDKESGQVGLAELLADFRKNCNGYHARSIQDPSWFKNGQRPVNYDMRKVNDPWLFAGTLITEVYEQNPAKFDAEYENYKLTTKVPVEEMLTYEAFMHYGYGINVPARVDNLEQFKAAREAQMDSDKKVREQQLINVKGVQPVQYNVESVSAVEGHKSK